MCTKYWKKTPNIHCDLTHFDSDETSAYLSGSFRLVRAIPAHPDVLQEYSSTDFSTVGLKQQHRISLSVDDTWSFKTDLQHTGSQNPLSFRLPVCFPLFIAEHPSQNILITNGPTLTWAMWWVWSWNEHWYNFSIWLLFCLFFCLI